MNRHLVASLALAASVVIAAAAPRERISLNDNWRFTKGDPNGDSTGLRYDVRPEVRDRRDDRAADAEPTEAEKIAATNKAVLKPWILPTANERPGRAPRASRGQTWSRNFVHPAGLR